MEVDLEYIKGYYCCMLYALDYHLEGEKVIEKFQIKLDFYKIYNTFNSI